MALTIEFWKQGENIYVEFNKNVYNFQEFLKKNESQIIIDSIYNKIIKDFTDEARGCKNKFEVVGKFIKNHFLKKDNLFDVVILDDGKVVKFNLEE